MTVPRPRKKKKRRPLLAISVGKHDDGRNVVHVELCPKSDEAFHWVDGGPITQEGPVIVPSLRHASTDLIERLISYEYGRRREDQRWLARHLERICLEAYACGKTGADFTVESLLKGLLRSVIALTKAATACKVVNEDVICKLLEDIIMASHAAGEAFAKSPAAMHARPFFALLDATPPAKNFGAN